MNMLYPVKTSPSKKRRAVTHGPMKKTATSGPSLSQTTSNNQHQVSSESKEDTEGDNGKNWERDVWFLLKCKQGWIMLTDSLRVSVFQHVPACEGLLSEQNINWFFLPSSTVMQSGRPDLLPKTFPPSNSVGKTNETAVVSLGKPGSAPTSQPPPHVQDNSRSVGADSNHTMSKAQEHSTPQSSEGGLHVNVRPHFETKARSLKVKVIQLQSTSKQNVIWITLLLF